MSVSVPATASVGLHATSNLSNPNNCTKLIWAKFGATPTAYNNLIWWANAAKTSYNVLQPSFSASAKLYVTSNTNNLAFVSQPTWANWTCFAISSTTAGAGSLIGYWQDNAGGGFVSQNTTGTTFTISDDLIVYGTGNTQITIAFYMEWSTILTLGNLNTQFTSATPSVQLGSLRRYLTLTNAASAGTDSSSNGFNMTAVGALADGSGLPTFGASGKGLLLGTNQGGF